MRLQIVTEPKNGCAAKFVSDRKVPCSRIHCLTLSRLSAGWCECLTNELALLALLGGASYTNQPVNQSIRNVNSVINKESYTGYSKKSLSFHISNYRINLTRHILEVVII